ncbi:MAG: Gfo/Idh/MocA family oxidoreductase [Moraxellaceae bacterium]|nr:Gfo/Idh/MocA family oxidoreductase [Moraxellaceae bacterium]
MKYLLVGTGNISRTYIGAIANIPGSEVVGCVSRSGRRPAVAPDMPCWPTITAAASAIDFDAVILTTPNGLHHEGATEAAALGKHVLTEKPLDITLSNMDRMIAACEAAGVTLATAYQRRTNPDNLAIKRLMEAGAFGRVYAADLAAKFWRDQAYYDSGAYRGGWALDGGGPFIQQACHNIDYYLWLFGMPDKVVSELGTFAHDIETEDHGAALLRYANGMIGTIIGSTAARPGFAARLEVHCERGSFVTLDDRIVTWEIDGIPNPANTTDIYDDKGASSAAVADTSRHEAILRDLEEAVRDGRPPLVTPQQARQTTELILRIYGRS